MQYAAQTNIGLVRERNEDNFVVLAESDNKPAIFIIADGLGGHKNGELASEIACKYASEQLAKLLPANNEPAKIHELLIDIVQKTNVHVYLNSLDDEDNNGMGTTLSIGVLYPESFYIAHIGDTRVYRLRNEELEQITLDHTFIGEMIASGTISEEEERSHPSRHILTQAIGFPEYLEVDYSHLDRVEGDRFLMSSDGLHGVIEEKEIYNLLSSQLEPEEICSQLIEKALQAGAPDNITVITIFV